MSIEIRKFKYVKKGYLVGFADISLLKMGLEIDGCGYFDKDGKTWMSMPSQEYTDKEGKKKYKTLFRFKEKADNDRFLDLVKKLVQEYIKSMPEGADAYIENNKPNDEVPF